MWTRAGRVYETEVIIIIPEIMSRAEAMSFEIKNNVPFAIR